MEGRGGRVHEEGTEREGRTDGGTDIPTLTIKYSRFMSVDNQLISFLHVWTYLFPFSTTSYPTVGIYISSLLDGFYLFF